MDYCAPVNSMFMGKQHNPLTPVLTKQTYVLYTDVWYSSNFVFCTVQLFTRIETTTATIRKIIHKESPPSFYSKKYLTYDILVLL